MQTVLKQIISIVLVSIMFGIIRFLLIGEEDFPLIKTEKILKKVEIFSNINSEKNLYNIPDLMTEPLLATIDFTKYYFDNNQAVIIDARDEEEYKEAHIKNSINIPYNYYEEYFDVLIELSPDKLYIVYCDGGECDLSLDLAYMLFDEFNFEKVFVYEGGLPAWREAKYPIEK